MPRQFILRYAAALVLFPLNAIAQPAPDDDAVVVTASRTEQRIRDAIPHTTVLTQKNIRDSQAVDLVTLLRTEAGFEMAQNGGIGATYAPLSLRGGRGSQVLILVDGVRVEDIAFSQTALQHIMLHEVDRVEIARGNVSSLYGSGAIGGVVQVFTKRGRGAPAAYADMMVGDRKTAKLGAGYGGQAGDTRFNVSVSRFGTRGFSAMDPRLEPLANPDPDGYRNDSIAGSLSHKLTARHEIGASFLRSRGRLDYDGNDPFVALDTPASIHNQLQTLGTMQGWWEARFVDAWKSRLTLGQGTDDRIEYRNGALDSSSNTRSRQLIWDNDVRLSPGHLVSAGVERLRQQLVNQDTGAGFAVGRHARRAEILRLGYLGRLGRHSLQGNFRAEHFSDVGKARTHFLGYGFDLTDAWRLTASNSTAFRAPTLSDLYSPFGGNPQVRPERARTNEVGIQWATEANRVRVVRFETKYLDAIGFSPVFPFPTFNIGRARSTGIETTYTGSILGADVRASMTIQDPVQQPEGGQEVRPIKRAQRLGSLAVHRTFGRWRLGGDLIGSGDRRDTHISTFANVHEAGYMVLNLTARYNIDKALFVSARLENALDEHYSLAHGFNTPRRGAFITVGWQQP
jgi:vitamin B12 transporter